MPGSTVQAGCAFAIKARTDGHNCSDRGLLVICHSSLVLEPLVRSRSGWASTDRTHGRKASVARTCSVGPRFLGSNPRIMTGRCMRSIYARCCAEAVVNGAAEYWWGRRTSVAASLSRHPLTIAPQNFRTQVWFLPWTSDLDLVSRSRVCSPHKSLREIADPINQGSAPASPGSPLEVGKSFDSRGSRGTLISCQSESSLPGCASFPIAHDGRGRDGVAHTFHIMECMRSLNLESRCGMR